MYKIILNFFHIFSHCIEYSPIFIPSITTITQNTFILWNNLPKHYYLFFLSVLYRISLVALQDYSFTY